MVRSLSNPDQTPGNTFVIQGANTGCCGSETTVCQYVTVPITGAEILGITFISPATGISKVVTFTTPLAKADRDGIERAIIDAIEAEGAIVTNEGGVGVSAILNAAGDVVITITGDVVMTSIQRTAGTTTFTANCTTRGYCQWSMTWPDAKVATSITIGGVNSVLGAIGVPTVSNVTPAIAAATGVLTVVSVVERTSDLFDITISVAPSSDVIFGILDATRLDCGQQYTV